MRLRLGLVLTLSAFFLLSSARAQESCTHCKNSGLHVCKNAACSDKACGTKLKHVCDQRYRAKCCQGFRHTLCKKCQSKEALAKFREFKKTRKQWLKSVKKVDLKVGIRFSHVETEHFYIHNSHTNWRFDRKDEQDRSSGAHIWAERVEAACDDVEKHFGKIRPGPKHRLYLTWTVADNMSAFRSYGHSLEYAKYSFRFGTTGEACRLFCFPDHETRYTDRGLHAFVYHHACYAALGYLGPKRRIPLWFGVGAAHWLDLKRGKRAHDLNVFQLPESQSIQNPWFIKANWNKLVAKRLKKKRVSLKGLFKQKVFTTLEEHALCWSMVNFLCRRKAKGRVKELVKAWASGMPWEKALEQSFGISVEDFESSWQRYALGGYK
ncbi:MAG: hypothetical protein V3W41_06480 [Planctomycetota bacterium]